jgi:hypothetical protein
MTHKPQAFHVVTQDKRGILREACTQPDYSAARCHAREYEARKINVSIMDRLGEVVYQKTYY